MEWAVELVAFLILLFSGAGIYLHRRNKALEKENEDMRRAERLKKIHQDTLDRDIDDLVRESNERFRLWDRQRRNKTDN